MKSPKRAASALVITLCMIVLITILVLGFVTTARLDVGSARLHLNGVKAEIFAQMGEEVALARLKAATATNRVWISEPGRIVASSPGVTQPLTNIVELFSGSSSELELPDKAADMNPALLENTNEFLVVPAGVFGTNSPKMPLRWIYVRKDGTFETNFPPAYDTANPLEGRFAFWTDDESGKVNLNTAWMKGAANTNAVSHPSRVSLERLLDADAPDVAQYRLKQFFNSPFEPRRVNTNVAELVNSNRFAITHYNHSPELNMFSEPRIFLTTQASNLPSEIATLPDAERSKYFLDILTTPNADPGVATNLSIPKVNSTVERIYQMLARADWPIAPGKSLIEKYENDASGHTNNYLRMQIALDILEYVRSRESSLEIVKSIRGKKIADTNTSAFSMGSSGDYMLGQTRRPRITEIGLWVSPTMVATNGGVLKVELYLPKGCGKVDLTQTDLTLQMRNGSGQPVPPLTGMPNILSSVPVVPGPPPGTLATNVVYLDSSDPYLQEDGYRVLTVKCRLPNSSGFSNASRPTSVSLRVLAAEDFAVLRQDGGNNLDYTIDAAAVPLGGITTLSVRDPIANTYHQDWLPGANTLGQPNSNVPALASISGPQQDKDSNNALTKGSWFPPPKGRSGNLNGVMGSVGELGFIHSGVTCEGGPSVPWRTLRLQPMVAGSSELPDWVLLDMFCVPASYASADEKSVVLPNSFSRGGKINVNSTVYPFVDASGDPVLNRSLPLEAVLVGASGNQNNASDAVDSTLASNLATFIQTHSLASNLGNEGRSYGGTNIYYSPWELCEIKGMADSGEESEALIRNTGGLLCARSGVFSIYTVGQSVRQDKSGGIAVLGERRSWSIVERVPKLESDGLSVVFKTVYSRAGQR